ncbi:NUDIX hydrolase [Sulfobacillus thermosulfidooxidans]|uniref:NUDIX hydrolase n=1 Tax=Sulfobacillus thermosulfidooxidans TaxID=28034 RepID=UPI000B1EE97C|nr:NUDIX domain-containing protein [Sulfobacillus thermosulfidooxidans]
MSDANEEKPNNFVQWRHAPASQWIYCPLCREPLLNHTWDGRERRYCSHCGFVYWERALPAVAVLVFEPSRKEILLVTRRYPPFVGGLTFPGGGIELGESVADAAVREVEEETGLVVSLDRQFGTWSTPSNDTIITFFRGHPIGGQLQAGTDAQEARFYPWEEAPSLAFSLHNMVLQLFRMEMRMTIPAS